MNDIFDLDPPKPQKRFIARSKGDKKEAGASKSGSTGPARKKGPGWNVSEGFRLKIKPLWILIGLLILLGCTLMMMHRPDKPQEALLKRVKNVKRGGPPRIREVFITPDKPIGKDLLVANADTSGGGNDKIFFKYQWYRNNTPISGQMGRNLSNAHFGKGDVIKVSVVPVMNAIEGKPMTSPSVSIRNSLPYIRSAVIKPYIVYSLTDLTVDAEAEDPDLDQVNFRYQWMKNGSEIRGQTSQELSHAHIAKNDRIQVQISPFDGTDYGRSMLSAIVVVNNSPPRIVSNPPSILRENGTYEYKVVAEDLDNDPLTYILSENNPPGVTIDSKNGRLFWRIPKNIEPGLNRIEIIVRDDDGAEASQWFSLNLQFAIN